MCGPCSRTAKCQMWSIANFFETEHIFFLSTIYLQYNQSGYDCSQKECGGANMHGALRTTLVSAALFWRAVLTCLNNLRWNCIISKSAFAYRYQGLQNNLTWRTFVVGYSVGFGNLNDIRFC